MLAYKCLSCGCIHGWIDHPKVTKIERDSRGGWEHVWWCPNCNREHRTTDGTMLGRTERLWSEVHDLSWEVIERRYFEDGSVEVVIERNELGEKRSTERRLWGRNYGRL